MTDNTSERAIKITSSQQLAMGHKASHKQLKAQWLKHSHDTGHAVFTSQNVEKPKARFFSVCSTAPTKGWKSALDTCRAHIEAVGQNRESMEITSLDLNHTCGADGARRKRNCKTIHLKDFSNVLGVCEPGGSGNSKQFIRMTKVATGVTIETGQAHSAASVKAHIGQFSWLPSLFEACKQADSGGTHIPEDDVCSFDSVLRQFSRCCVCLSIAKRFWTCAVIKLIMCNGTFTRGKAFEQTILIATAFDGNNQLVALAFAVCDVENASNWVWFKECLDSDFPRHSVWMRDADKGICSDAFSVSMSQTIDDFLLSRCARHLSDNCKEACKKNKSC